MIALALVLGTSAGRAALVTINNPSFEDDSSSATTNPGEYSGEGHGASFPNTYGSGANWVGHGGSPAGFYTGEYHITTTDYSLGAPNGHNVAFLDQGFGGGYITQDLTATLLANTVYTLTGYIGSRSGSGMTGTALVELIAGSTVIATGTLNAPTQGTFQSWSINTSSDTTSFLSGLLGQNLQIYLGASTGGQVNYDNISLDATPVPEMENEALALFGILAVGGVAGRRWLASRKNALQSSASL